MCGGQGIRVDLVNLQDADSARTLTYILFVKKCVHTELPASGFPVPEIEVRCGVFPSRYRRSEKPVVLSQNLIFFRSPPPKFGANPTHLDPTTIKAQKISQIGEIDAGTMYDWCILGVATLRRLR